MIVPPAVTKVEDEPQQQPDNQAPPVFRRKRKKVHEMCGPAVGNGGGSDGILQNQIPPYDPGKKLAECCISSGFAIVLPFAAVTVYSKLRILKPFRLCTFEFLQRMR
jgi:hypothetical protein